MIKLKKSYAFRPSFTEIGYFGEASWYEAKEFEENNSEGWRLPTDEEVRSMIAMYLENMQRLCNQNCFWMWTCVENGELAHFVDVDGDVFDGDYKSNDEDYSVFCVR